MKVTVEKVDEINYIFKGSVDNSVIEAKAAQLKEAAPESVDEENPAPERFEQDAAGAIFGEFIDAGMKEANIPVETLLGQPGLKKYEKNDSSVYFEVDIATSPTVNVENITYDDIIPSYTKPVAKAEDVEKRLAEFAKQQAPYKAIATPKAIESGDVAVIDFKGFIDGVAFEGGSAENFKLQIGSQSFIPGFEEQLLGMEYGEDRTITVHFPKDYQSPELAGKEAQFEIKFHEIQEQQPEDPDDDFAKRILNDESATLETLKGKFSDQITADELSQLYENELKPQLIKGLLGKFDFPLPNNIVEQEIDAKVRQQVQKLTPEEQKSTVEDKEKFFAMRDAVRQEAQDGIKIALIVEALAKKEGVDVDENEVISALTHQAMMTGQDAHKLVQYYKDNNLMKSAQLGLTEDKLFGQILGFNK